MNETKRESPWAVDGHVRSLHGVVGGSITGGPTLLGILYVDAYSGAHLAGLARGVNSVDRPPATGLFYF